jgi:hypothetical protein
MLFSGHETFPFRHGWLKKGVDAVLEDPAIFSAEDATTRLGVGKNMVRSIRHWVLACGLMVEKPIPKTRDKAIHQTPLGELLVAAGGLDPYLEDVSTLWILHYLLTRSAGRSQSWHWLFNNWKAREFYKEEIVRELVAFSHSASGRVNANTIRRDIDCLISCYVTRRDPKKKSLSEDSLDCPLAELGLIEEVGDGETYVFQVGDHQTLSGRVFAYCLMDYWERLHDNQETLAFEQISYAAGSPAKLFKLSYAALMRHLESLDRNTSGALSFDETAGLRQVYRRKKISSLEILKQVYAEEALALC